MDMRAYDLMIQQEQNHWWFRARRDLLKKQIHRATMEMGLSKSECQILDFGCGTDLNMKLLSNYGHVIGADTFQLNRKIFLKSSEFTILDSKSILPYYKEKFDIITALDVIEHIENHDEAISNLQQLLKSPGQCIITVPAFDWLWGEEDEISQHKRRYNKRTLTNLINTTEMKIKFISYFFIMPLAPMAAVVKLMRILPKSPQNRGNLFPLPSPLNNLIYQITRLETSLVGTEKGSLPFGTSLLARIEKGRS